MRTVLTCGTPVLPPCIAVTTLQVVMPFQNTGPGFRVVVLNATAFIALKAPGECVRACVSE